jgi:hypothetical protein
LGVHALNAAGWYVVTLRSPAMQQAMSAAEELEPGYYQFNSEFFFQSQEVAERFENRWALMLGPLIRKNIPFAAPLRKSGWVFEPTGQELDDFYDDMKALGSEVSVIDYDFGWAGIRSEECAAKASLLGYQVMDLRGRRL